MVFSDGVIKIDLKRKLEAPSEPVVPKLYGLPKIHKPEPIPVRPIVRSIGSVTYNLAKHAAHILRPLVGQSLQHLQNTQVFIEKIKDLKLTASETITLFDVAALFTSIPPDDAILVVWHALEKDGSWKERTALDIDQAVELIDICLSCYPFKGSFFKQHECAMGSPMSPIVANLCMEPFEVTTLSSYSGTPPKLWLRYVDDTL